MEVELNKENICISRLVAQKKELIFIEEDMIVPDSKPDVLSIINVKGNVCVFKKEVVQDKVKIEGNVNTYIMYLPDSKENNLRGLNCTMDFSENISIPGAKEGMLLVTKCEIKDMECKVINGRKISLKAGIEFCISLYSNEDTEIVNSIQNLSGVQTLNKNFEANSLKGYGKTTIYAKDTLEVDSNDNILEILNVNIDICNKDFKFSYNKVLTKAEAKLKILYLTENGKIKNLEGTLPIVGFIDIQNISEDNICDIYYDIRNILVKPNSAEEHSIYVELEVEANCMAYEKKNISLIQDLYLPTANLEYTQKNAQLSCNKSENVNEFTIRGKANIPNLEEKDLVDVETNVNVANVKITDDKILYSGNIYLNFVYFSGNSLNSRNTKIPFEAEIQNPQNSENINVEYDILLKSLKYKFENNGDINVEISMEINTKTSKNINMNIIDNIKISDKNDTSNNDYDSLILYIAQPGDSLWKIAKRFNSTIDDIVRMNGIEDANIIDIGQKIYIPKFNYIKE